jgi:hypothetical protein
VLREPVARSLSHLEHVARDPHHPQHERVRSYGGELDAVLVASIDHVGVTERLDLVLREVARAQGWLAPAAAPRDNAAGAERVFPYQRLTPARRRAVEQLCRADLVLYRAAQVRAAASAARERRLVW